jgi:hypothetical protein
MLSDGMKARDSIQLNITANVVNVLYGQLTWFGPYNPYFKSSYVMYHTVLQFLLAPSKWPLSPGFPTKTLYTFLFSHIDVTCPACLVLLDFII